MTEPGEGWRVSIGTGLLVHTPMGDAQREAIARETERERLKAERAAALEEELNLEAEKEREL